MTERHIKIIGAGLAGALLATLLAQRGWKVDVFEKQPGAYPLPRAVHFDHEVVAGGSKAGIAKDKPAASATTTPAQVSGSVTISAAVKARAAPEDTVFIVARAADGSPAPLAVLRKRVADLPSKFVLDDSMARAAGMNLSKFGTVIVGARISKSGKPARQPGDLEALSKPVKVGASGLSIVIDQEVP